MRIPIHRKAGHAYVPMGLLDTIPIISSLFSALFFIFPLLSSIVFSKHVHVHVHPYIHS